MGPYKKVYDDSAIDDGWAVEDGDGEKIAYLVTELLADAVLDHLMGRGRAEGAPPTSYPIDEPID